MAVSEEVPAGTLLHVKWYGAPVTVPIGVAPAKNCTFATLPSSVADAPTVIVAGAVNVAPAAGLVSDTAGGAFGGAAVVTVTLSKVAVASVPATWLLTPRPIKAVLPSAIVSLPTAVQVTPSADS